MTNRQIASLLEEIALFLEMDDVPFKPRAYRIAAQTIMSLKQDVRDIYAAQGRKGLLEIPGVGQAIAEKIEELIQTKQLRYYNQLKKKYPVEILALTSIEGIGPKKVKNLYRRLHIRTLKDLEQAAKSGTISHIEKFGQKTEKNILQSIAYYKASHDRFLIHDIYPEAERMIELLNRSGQFTRLEVAGSIRRMKETVGDVDFLGVAKNSTAAMQAFVSLPMTVNVLAHGRTKSVIRHKHGFDVDLRLVQNGQFGAALLYFSGSKQHNIDLRQRALRLHYTLNEYGLFSPANKKMRKKYEQPIAGQTEQDVYRALGLSYIPPEVREDPDCIARAEANDIPALIDYTDLCGDLQVQTNWTDGSGSIRDMALAARDCGLHYIAITDHTKTLAFAGGSNEADLRRQMKAIDKLNQELKGKPSILTGAEVNILKDGSLDIDDETLTKLDIVGAAVHTNVAMPRAQMTRRICRAMENPHVDILFHPTGRIVNGRAEYDVDMPAIFAAAKKTKTILEINASERLDLRDSYIKEAVALGVRCVINSDAHDPAHFAWLKFGIGQARRGWATKAHIVNTYSEKKIRAFFKKEKHRR